jgi:hypothetical protein
VTDIPEEPVLSAEEAVQRSWIRLRRAVNHRSHNEDADRWRRINDRNNFSAAVEAAMQWREP